MTPGEAVVLGWTILAVACLVLLHMAARSSARGSDAGSGGTDGAGRREGGDGDRREASAGTDA